MELWAELFSDSVGIMSALVLGFLIAMAIWFSWYFISHMMKDSEKINAVAKASNDDKHCGPDSPS